MSAELWILFGTFVAGAGAATFTWVQAQAAVGSRKDAEKAQERAEEARDEALELARQATAAAERQATALETANTIAATKGPEFALVRGDQYLWTLYNVGSVALLQARLVGSGGGPAPEGQDFPYDRGLLDIPDVFPRDILPGDSIEFKASWSATGGDVSASLIGTWENGSTLSTWTQSWTFGMEDYR
jgi:hypothetical protein